MSSFSQVFKSLLKMYFALQRSVLLFLDVHANHKTLDSINVCLENDIIMTTFPPHTSNKLQSLDVGVFGPFKVYLSAEMEKYMTNQPELCQRTNYKISFLKAFSPTNILEGF